MIIALIALVGLFFILSANSVYEATRQATKADVVFALGLIVISIAAASEAVVSQLKKHVQ